MRSLSPRAALQLTAVGVLFAISCSGGAGGGGCGGNAGCGGGCGSGTYMYPKNDPARPDARLQPESARVRITQAFIDFIKPQLPSLIRDQLGNSAGMTVDRNNVLHIAIPNADLFDIGVASAKLRDGEALIWLDDLNTRLDLRFEPPNGLRFTLRNLRFGVNLKLKEDVAGASSSCPITGNLGMGPIRHAAEISINTLIEPGVGPDPDRNLDIAVKIDDIELNGLAVRVEGSNVYCQEPECRDCALEVAGNCLDPGGRCAECDIFCGGITDGILRLANSLIDLLRPLLNRVLQPVVQNFVRSALADINGQPAKLEQQLNIADLAGIDALKGAAPVGLFVAPEPGKFPVIDRGTGTGMEITATGGAEGELADCIADLEPFNMPKGPVPVLGGTDSRGRPYHMGMTLSAAYLNQILYAFHRSGSLCIKLGSADVKKLTGGKFTLNASLLSLLASDLSKIATDTAPVIIQLKPRRAPVLDLGSGQVIGQDAMGNDVYDWLIQLGLEDLGLAFHVLVQDRYVRIFEVTMDLNVGLNVNVLPDNKLEVAIGKLKIDGFQEEYNEILPNADFAMVLPTLIDLALQAVLTNQLKFDLDITDAVSNALGGLPIYMRVNEIRRDGVQEDYLTLTLTFSTSTSGPNLSLAAQTYARLAEDDLLHEKVDGTDAVKPSGAIRLRVGEDLPYSDQHELEYQLRVDAGMWHTYQRARPDGTLVVEDGHLILPGVHKVEVRARFTDAYETLDPTPAVVEALVDPLAPSVEARVVDDAVFVRVHDVGTPPARLTVQAAKDGGSAFAIALTPSGEDTADGTIPLASLHGTGVLSLQAVDAIGNKSGVAKVRLGLASDPAPAQDAQGCACSASHGGSDSIAGSLLVLLALALVVRFRNASAGAARK